MPVHPFGDSIWYADGGEVALFRALLLIIAPCALETLLVAEILGSLPYAGIG